MKLLIKFLNVFNAENNFLIDVKWFCRRESRKFGVVHFNFYNVYTC